MFKMEFRETDTMKDVLIRAQKEKSYFFVLLKSGKEYNGMIKEVGQHCIVFEQKGSRSFYDAIIRIEDVSSIEVRVRGD